MNTYTQGDSTTVRRKSPRVSRDQVIHLIRCVADRDHARTRTAALQIAATLGEPHGEHIRALLARSPDLPEKLRAYWAQREHQTRPWYPATVSESIRDLLDELRYRDAVRAAGLVPLSRVLLSGPPGCGKTMTACWLADAQRVPALVLSLSDVVTGYMGATSAAIGKALGGIADVPGVWILDELDAVAARRGGGDNDGATRERNAIVNSLCITLDTLGTPAGLVVATTNRIDVLDPAIVRRFDAVIEWPEPSPELLAQFSAALGYAGEASTYADVTSGIARQRRREAIARARAAEEQGNHGR